MDIYVDAYTHHPPTLRSAERNETTNVPIVVRRRICLKHLASCPASNMVRAVCG